MLYQQMDGVIPTMFRVEGILRLYHWKTRSFARHKASCEAIGHVVSAMDTIVETLLGHVGRDALIANGFSVQYVTPNDATIVMELQALCDWLNGWRWAAQWTDIQNLRDDLVGKIRQVLYLMTLE